MEVVNRVLEAPESERAALLRTACGDDSGLLAEARSMVAIETRDLDHIAPPLAELGMPRSIGGFEVVEEIGHGGMATVYGARPLDGDDPRPVAVKLLRHGLVGSDVHRRFEREGQILGRFRHPHIAAIYGSGLHRDGLSETRVDAGASDGGRPYLVMERVDGEPIDRYCRRHGLDVEQRLRLLVAVCRAVAHAHRCLVVHRDLKPSNILITSNGEPKLVDFGISKLLDAETLDPTTVTRHGLQLMTPRYASPEQVRGEPITTACDVYGLGVVLYELLVGRRPFDGPPETVLCQVLEKQPVRPSRAAAARAADERPAGRLNADHDAIVLRALAKDARQRYASPDQLADDIERLLDNRPVRARSAGWLDRGVKLVRRHGRLSAAIGLLALVLSVGLWERERTRGALTQQRDRAVAAQGFLIEIFDHADPRLGHDGKLEVEDLLGHGIERLDELDDRPVLKAALAQVFGRLELNLGHLERARELLETALELQIRHLDDESPERAATRDLLGRLCDSLGEHDRAAEHLERALAFRRAQTPVDVEAYASVLSNSAVNLVARGRRAEAEARARENLAFRLEHLSGRPLEVAVGYNNLGYVLLMSNTPKTVDADEVERLFRRGLELQIQEFGRRHPDVAVSHNNLATAILTRGEHPDEARPHLEEALGIWRVFFDERHPYVLTGRLNLVRIEHLAGRPTRGLEMLDALEPSITTLLGPDSGPHLDAQRLRASMERSLLDAEG